MIAGVPLMVACRLTQGEIGLGRALAVGWVVFGLVLGPLTWRMWREWGGEV